MGRILGRLGTDVGTDKTCKIVNVYRPWDGGTDKLGGEKGHGPKLEGRNQKSEGIHEERGASKRDSGSEYRAAGPSRFTVARSFLRSNGNQLFRGAEEQGSVGDGRGGQADAAEFVAGNDAEGPAGGDDEYVAFFTGDVKLATSHDG